MVCTFFFRFSLTLTSRPQASSSQCRVLMMRLARRWAARAIVAAPSSSTGNVGQKVGRQQIPKLIDKRFVGRVHFLHRLWHRLECYLQYISGQRVNIAAIRKSFGHPEKVCTTAAAALVLLERRIPGTRLPCLQSLSLSDDLCTHLALVQWPVSGDQVFGALRDGRLHQPIQTSPQVFVLVICNGKKARQTLKSWRQYWKQQTLSLTQFIVEHRRKVHCRTGTARNGRVIRIEAFGHFLRHRDSRIVVGHDICGTTREAGCEPQKIYSTQRPLHKPSSLSGASPATITQSWSLCSPSGRTGSPRTSIFSIVYFTPRMRIIVNNNQLDQYLFFICIRECYWTCGSNFHVCELLFQSP